MAACELCGGGNLPIRQAIASNVNVDACTRCIETMGLDLFESPFQRTPKKSTKPKRQSSSIRNYKQSVSETLVIDFHVRIRNERLSRGWAQKDLAMKMNERKNTIQRIENGTRPTDELVTKLEKVLGISLHEVSEAEYDAKISHGHGRGMTIADALDDFLTKGESDD